MCGKAPPTHPKPDRQVDWQNGYKIKKLKKSKMEIISRSIKY
jgi:hypothetical protein